MDGPVRQLIDVNGATLEVFLAGAGDPVVCRSHPFAPRSADLTWPWDTRMGRLVAVNPRGVGGSPGGPDPRDFTLAQHVEDLEAVRNQLGVVRWVL
jgi:pimeloyl-ACP methyl ester carboxylesterase